MAVSGSRQVGGAGAARAREKRAPIVGVPLLPRPSPLALRSIPLRSISIAVLMEKAAAGGPGGVLGGGGGLRARG